MPEERRLMNQTRDPRGGYTLLEVLVAVCLITIGLLGVFQLLSSTILTNVDTRNQALATHYAERLMEDVRNTSFSSLPVGTTSGNTTTDPDLASLSNDATWEREIAAVSSSLHSVTVSVNWSDPRGAQSVTLSTLVHQSGINSIAAHGVVSRR